MNKIIILLLIISGIGYYISINKNKTVESKVTIDISTNQNYEAEQEKRDEELQRQINEQISISNAMMELERVKKKTEQNILIEEQKRVDLTNRSYINAFNIKQKEDGSISITINTKTVNVEKITIVSNNGNKKFNLMCKKGILSLDYTEILENEFKSICPKILTIDERHTTTIRVKQNEYKDEKIGISILPTSYDNEHITIRGIYQGNEVDIRFYNVVDYDSIEQVTGGKTIIIPKNTYYVINKVTPNINQNRVFNQSKYRTSTIR